LLDNNVVNETDKYFQPRQDPKEEIAQESDNTIDKNPENILELTTPEVVRMTGISRKTLENRYKTDRLPFAKNGYTITDKLGFAKSENGKRSNLWKVQKVDNESD
jgi:hypothetical protein